MARLTSVQCCMNSVPPNPSLVCPESLHPRLPSLDPTTPPPTAPRFRGSGCRGRLAGVSRVNQSGLAVSLSSGAGVCRVRRLLARDGGAVVGRCRGTSETDMESVIFTICMLGGVFIGAALFGNNGGLVGLFVGGFIGYRLSEQFSSRGKVKHSTSTRRPTPDVLTTKLLTGSLTTFVVGVTFENRQTVVAGLLEGDTIYLVREPDNPHDKNAIQVMAIKKTSDGEIQLKRPDAYKASLFTGIPIEEYFVMQQIGYISRELAEKIAPVFDKYAWGPNRFVKASVTRLHDEPYKPMGVQITFRLPTEGDLEEAKIKMMMRPPPYL